MLAASAGLIWKRQYGDMANLSWLRRHATELNAQQQFMAASSSNGGGGMGGGERAVQVQAYQVPQPCLAWLAAELCCGADGVHACFAQPAVSSWQWRASGLSLVACLTADTHTNACFCGPAASSSPAGRCGDRRRRDSSGSAARQREPAKKLANHRAKRAAAVAPEPLAVGAAGSSSDQEAVLAAPEAQQLPSAPPQA